MLKFIWDGKGTRAVKTHWEQKIKWEESAYPSAMQSVAIQLP